MPRAPVDAFPTPYSSPITCSTAGNASSNVCTSACAHEMSNTSRNVEAGIFDMEDFLEDGGSKRISARLAICLRMRPHRRHCEAAQSSDSLRQMKTAARAGLARDQSVKPASRCRKIPEATKIVSVFNSGFRHVLRNRNLSRKHRRVTTRSKTAHARDSVRLRSPLSDRQQR